MAVAIEFSNTSPDDLQKVMDLIHDENDSCIEKISEQYGISYAWAVSIWYLRTRSRWTKELDSELVNLAKQNAPLVNINEWPIETK